MANGFSAAAFVNVNAATADLLSAGDFALKSIDWTYEYAGEPQPKQADSGNLPGNSFVRQITVNLVIQVLGTSASDYWTNRATLVAAFLVADGAQTNYQHGRLSVTPQGGSSMYVDCNVTNFALPLSFDDTPAFVSTATISLRANRGAWLATSGGAVVKL